MEQVPRPGVVVGAGPMVRALADRLGLVPVIDAMVAWDADRYRLSSGERFLALLLNLLTERQPLYAVADAFALTDVPLLLGADVTAADLTDDALGRALDKLAAAGAAAVFSAVTSAPSSSGTSVKPEGVRHRIERLALRKQIEEEGEDPLAGREPAAIRIPRDHRVDDGDEAEAVREGPDHGARADDHPGTG